MSARGLARVRELGRDDAVRVGRAGSARVMNAGRPDTHSAATDFGGLPMNTHRTGSRMLLAASTALLAGVALHGVDHALQERGIGALTTEVRVGGLTNAALAVIAFVLALRDHPRAPLVAAGVGAYL